MSKIVDTNVGRFRQVTDDKDKWFLWECPNCGSWSGMSDGQLEGKVSVVCSGPNGRGGCDYHATHEFGASLVAAMQAKILMGYKPYYEEGKDKWQPSRDGGVDGVI